MRRNCRSLLLLFGTSAVMQAAAATASLYAKLPLAFERQGEGSGERYVARGNGYMIALERGTATIGIQSQAGYSAVAMEFSGSRRVTGTTGPELPGKVNHLDGNDPERWRLGLSTYGSISYRGIYDAVDVVYRGNQRQMEFDLVLRPGADPKQIRMRFSGADELALDLDGALVVRSAAGNLRIPPPVIYQEAGSTRETIQGRYGLLANREVGFRLDTYDRSKAVVIDPTIVYAGLIGGGTDLTQPQAIALDSASNAYVTGYTYASDFPTANAAFSQAHSMPDGFVSKIDASGTLLYSTYIGGTSDDEFFSIAVDTTGAAWVTGYTSSVDFPVVNAYQSTLKNTSDAVVVKLSPSGVLLFSTYLGSGSYGYGIAVDPAGNAYAAGFVFGTFPTTPGAYLTSSPGLSGFVAKFSSIGALIYSTYLGGAVSDCANAIAIDTDGNAYVTGSSYSTGFANAPPGGAQVSNKGGGDAFVAKLNAAGNALVYFTFLGGSQWDYGQAIAVDAGRNAYVGGYTSSADFPATAGALQQVFGGGSDGFVAKLNSDGSAFTYVTYLGTNRQEDVQGLAIDGSGNAYVTGYTDSAQFPTVAASQGSLPGNSVSLFQTTNTGASWTPFDANIPGVVTSISPDPTPGVLVAGTESGIFRSTDSGQTWTMASTVANAYLSRSPASSSTIYAISSTSAYRSTDGGASWSPPGSIGDYVTVIVADPADANTAYAYNTWGSTLYKTTNGGLAWYPNSLPSSPDIVSMVAASDGSLYVDTSGNGVYKSTDQGTSWAAVNSGLGSLNGPPNGLAVSASNPKVLYKSVYGDVIYNTMDGGASWTAAGSAPVALGALAVSALNPSLVYLVANSRIPAVYVSPDGGATWTAAGTGLETASATQSVTQVVSDPTNGSAAYVLADVTTAAFAAKINSTGSSLVYSTYLGGAGNTYGYGIATNSSGDAFVTGYTEGAFPVTSTALQESPGSGYAFVVHIADTIATCSISVTPATQIVYSSAAVSTFSVVAPSGCTWGVASNQPWAVIANGTAGSGSGVVSVAVSANNTGATRAATLTIGSQSASLNQAPSSCSYTLGTPSVSLGATGGTVQTTLLTDAGCPWSVVNNYPFAVSVASGASGTGNGTVVLNVGPTASQASRTLYVGIGDASLTISQTGYYCTYTFSPPSILLGGSGDSGSIAVTTQDGCAWTAFSTDTSWLTITSDSSGTGSGTVNYSAAADTGAARTASLNIDVGSVPVTETLGQQFVPVTPCRIADTRNPSGPFGGPAITGKTARSFVIPNSACPIPSTATAYSINVTVVPHGMLGYLTVWPTAPGLARPLASTLNSLDGRVKANAAIVPAGAGGAISVYVTDTTDVVLDINGYFVATPTSSTSTFFPLRPCRIADTRSKTAPLGGPFIAGGQDRTLPVLSSSCNVPATAQAYSLNFTAVPHGSLGYITTWPTGSGRPLVSTLNAITGQVTANAAIVPAGDGGQIDVFAMNDTDLVIDINGYFAQSGAGGLSLYNVTPCRVLDTRNPSGAPPLSGTQSASVAGSQCAPPDTAQAYVLSATVVPSGVLGYLTLWPEGQTKPLASTLNALDGAVTSNMAIVPTTDGSIESFTDQSTYLVLDILGYFAP